MITRERVYVKGTTPVSKRQPARDHFYPVDIEVHRLAAKCGAVLTFLWPGWNETTPLLCDFPPDHEGDHGANITARIEWPTA